MVPHFFLVLVSKHSGKTTVLKWHKSSGLLNHHTWGTSGNNKRKMQATVGGSSPLMESKDAKVQANWLHDAKNAHTLSCWSRRGCLINSTCAHGNKQAEWAWLLLQPDNASSHSNKYKPSCALLTDVCLVEWNCLLALKNRFSDGSTADDWKQRIHI